MTRTLAALVGVLLPLAAAVAAAPNADPNWPCQQALVPELSAGMVWNGPSLEGVGDWHDDPSAAALVRRAAPEEVKAADGEAAIAQFLKDLDGDRARAIALAFAGLLDETNRARSEVIRRIKDLGERQRKLAALIKRLTGELDALPADDTAARTELQQRWTYTSMSYNDVQHTMRYACEVPVTLDARLGAYARALEAGINERK
jgi:hypothetical protein